MVCAEYPYGMYWEVHTAPRLLELQGVRVPCFSLEEERLAYIRLGMEKMAESIGNFLKED